MQRGPMQTTKLTKPPQLACVSESPSHTSAVSRSDRIVTSLGCMPHYENRKIHAADCEQLKCCPIGLIHLEDSYSNLPV
jgi:hypothetical protein